MNDDIRKSRVAAFEARLEELIAAGEISTVHDWCRRAGVGWSTVKDFRVGQTQMLSERTLLKLAAAVGRSLDWIKGEDASPIDADKEQRWRALFNRLPPEAQQEWLDMLEARVNLKPQTK